MEKRTPQYGLDLIKTCIVERRYRVTQSARAGAARLGYDEAGLLAVLAKLQRSDFYKSMTTHADHTVWQDVCRPVTEHGAVYLKLTLTENLLIVSFKEK